MPKFLYRGLSLENCGLSVYGIMSCRESAPERGTHRVIQVRRFGDPDGLEVIDTPMPATGRGEVRVRVLASSIEYTDVTIRRHLYPWVFRRPPFVLGYDVVGDIDQLGDGVSGLQLGDRVADMTVLGSNAAYRTIRADRVTRVPAGVDAAEAATLILSWTTAYQLLRRVARVQRGQRVLVQGAAGAVGQALLVLGKMAGLKLWGTGRGEHAALPASSAPRRSTTNTKTSRVSCRAGSTSYSTVSARMAFAALSRRSSAAACFAHTATRRAYRHNVACSPC
jgi:D-arabinose 1-dehydrogenase-like Zn-dependent alcohol dehydrogenase